MSQSIRDLTLGAKSKFRTKEIEYEGTKVQFRQLSLRERKELLERSKGTDGEIDNTKLQVNAVIAMTVDPVTDKKVFTKADFDTMMDAPTGGYVDTFVEAAMSLWGAEEDSGKEQEEV